MITYTLLVRLTVLTTLMCSEMRGTNPKLEPNKRGGSMCGPITPRRLCTRTLHLLFFPIDASLLSLVNVRKQTRKIYLERKRTQKHQEGLIVKNVNVVQ